MAKNKSKKGAKKASKPEETKLKAEEVVEAEVVETEETEEVEKTEKSKKVEEAEEVVEEKDEEVEDSEDEKDESDEDEADESDEDDDNDDDDDDDDEKEEKKKISSKKCHPIKTFFACKHDKSENILTIFKSPRIWGALIGEMLGTMFILIFLQLIGIYPDLLFTLFAGVTLLTFTLSGAHLNPAITLGMMLSRRISAIRGVLYILAQVLGAWLGFLFQTAFLNAGEGTYEITTMTEVLPEQFWIVAAIEFIGAIMLGFVYCRALAYKKRPLVLALTIGFGFSMVYLIMLVVSSRFLALSGNFMLNPAVSLMFKILPTSGEDFGQIFGQTMQALAIYCIFPMIGAAIGFAVSDIARLLSGEDKCERGCPCGEKCHCGEGEKCLCKKEA